MKKFFIIGCPRSGTTMLQVALNRHSDIVIPPETKFFFSFLGRSRATQARHVERLRHDLCIDLPAPDWCVKSPDEARAFFDRVVELYLMQLGRLDATCLGEKTPEHTSRIRQIKRLFPEAKLIVLYRDGRDVALSLSKVPWMTNDINVSFAIWRYYQQILLRLKNEDRSDTLFVRYEDLVNHPQVQLRRILDFLELDYEPRVADGAGNSEGIPRREYAWKSRALERITSDRVGVWKRELSPYQVAALEELGHRELTGFGYRLSTPVKGFLPPWFYVCLYWKLSLFAVRLPWISVAKDLLEKWVVPHGMKG